MIVETIRAWTDWLQDSTYGVNAKLAALTLDGTDTVPADVASFADETRTASAARRQVPDTLPALIIRLQGPATIDPSVGPNVAHRDGTIPVLMAYAASNESSAVGNRDAIYTLQAIRQSLTDFMDPTITAANTARTRGNIQILNVTDLQHLTTFETYQDTDVLGAMIITFQVRDLAP